MKIEIKILNKEFYKRSNEQNLSYPPKDIYDLPSYATLGSAAMDLICTEDVIIYPGETTAIPTGIAIWIGSSTYNKRDEISFNNNIAALIIPRSGLGTKGLVLANTIGLIDEDYQGELIVQAWNRNESNTSEEPFSLKGDIVFETCEVEHNCIELKAGDRFAQLMFVPIIKAQWNVVEEFSSQTERNNGGFGSTD